MVTIDNVHADLIHDAELDYYGKRLGTCSSDRSIKLFDIDGDSHKLIDTLRGHQGPVWQLSWAHPKFGGLLASCSYDGSVIFWREENGSWPAVAVHAEHQASVNSVQWAPVEYGCKALCASSDGSVSIVELHEDNTLSSELIPTHQIGVNSANWAPALPNSDQRFVSGGSDNLVKIWKRQGDKWVNEATLEGHTDWVRDVAWSPSLLLKSYVASGSQDKTVIIWTQQGVQGEWHKRLLRKEKFPDVVWRVSWSLSGNILAVSGGDNKVSLWKETLDGDWESAGEVQE